MSKSNRTVLPVAPTAAHVRATLVARGVENLPEAARKSVLGRGVLHGAAVAAYNKGKVEAKRYVPGNSKAAAAKSQAQRAALREAGLLGEKARGPLSAAAKAHLAQTKV